MDKLLSNTDKKDTRTRIIEATVKLIDIGGKTAATTRAISEAAEVQAPTIYRLFNDKQGLLDAVANHRLNSYITEKSIRPRHSDPIQDLREGWDIHVSFGLANPEIFEILSGNAMQQQHSSATETGRGLLKEKIAAIAKAGKLKTSEERALNLLTSVGTGTVATLLKQPQEHRDLGLIETAREAVISAITHEPQHTENVTLKSTAITLKASLNQATNLSNGERLLLTELLDRIAK
ncbi:TetR/AcrR family transcriptional regulator [Hirschia baltica]|uniref:Transcriptional regulator, TetR family n=1 Tax=Hirschia baltica (strain ATCC 49814 / DSM 5838 / IFAM 1418) TaxID=582402 RepID=C6XNR1_HIRBI|nr:TetR/AcrR family transcriptional regulator [Hirschia baltica]ACT58314.1 transcriptional regulator, TetR family [Hirschia baltica ATCC 49814]